MTERTDWKRPNYRLLNSTGENLTVNSRNTRQSTSRQGESASTHQDTEQDTSAAASGPSSSSLTNTSTPVEAASAESQQDSDLSPTEQFHSPITDISLQFAHFSFAEAEGSSVPHTVEEIAQAVVDFAEEVASQVNLEDTVVVEQVQSSLQSPESPVVSH